MSDLVNFSRTRGRGFRREHKKVCFLRGMKCIERRRRVRLHVILSNILSIAGMEGEGWLLRRCRRARQGVRLRGEHPHRAPASERDARLREVESG